MLGFVSRGDLDPTGEIVLCRVLAASNATPGCKRASPSPGGAAASVRITRTFPAAPFPQCRETASGGLSIVELPRVDQRPTVMRLYTVVVAAAALLVACSSTPSEPEGACAAPTPGQQQAGPCNDFGTGEGPLGG